MKVMSYYFSVFGRGVGSKVRPRKIPGGKCYASHPLSVSVSRKVMVEQFSLPLGGERGELVWGLPHNSDVKSYVEELHFS